MERSNLPFRALLSDKHFAQMIAREKELHRISFFEQGFNAAIIEELAMLLWSTWRHHQRLLILNSVVVDRNLRDFVICVEESQNEASWFYHPQQLFDGLLNDGRN